MAISEQDVRRIARLARIQLPPEDTIQAQKDLGRILELMARLRAVDTQGVEPMAHPLSGHQEVELRLREDKAAPAQTEQQRSELMSNSPAQTEGLFLVPTVIE